MGTLQNKTVIVTGAGTGIGRAAALKFGAHGARVVCVGRRSGPIEATSSAVHKEGGEAVHYCADVEDGDQAAAIPEFAVSRYDRLDVIVHNAGHSSRNRSLHYVTEEEWSSVFAVNVHGLYRMTQAALPYLLIKGENKEGGTVITVSSVAALTPNLLGGAPYGAAKAASYNLMRFIASELRNEGIRACTVLPAEVDTPILDNRPLPPAKEVRDLMMKPEDIADAILLCASMPHRTMVQEVVLYPTRSRDTSMDIEAARQQAK